MNIHPKCSELSTKCVYNLRRQWIKRTETHFIQTEWRLLKSYFSCNKEQSLYFKHNCLLVGNWNNSFQPHLPLPTSSHKCLVMDFALYEIQISWCCSTQSFMLIQIHGNSILLSVNKWAACKLWTDVCTIICIFSHMLILFTETYIYISLNIITLW